MLQVLIPAYRAQDFLEETIESFANQSVKIDYEIIVVIDGCGETLAKAMKIDDANTRFYYTFDNHGRYAATNTAIALSTADEILFFDADDIAHPMLFEELQKVDADVIRFLFKKFRDEWVKEFPKSDFGIVAMNEKKLPLVKKRIINDKVNNHGYANGILYVKRKVLDVLGGYQEWRCSADTEFLTRLKYTDFKHIGLQRPLFYYRQHENSLTNKVAIKDRLEQHKEIRSYYNSEELLIKTEKKDGKFI